VKIGIRTETPAVINVTDKPDRVDRNWIIGLSEFDAVGMTPSSSLKMDLEKDELPLLKAMDNFLFIPDFRADHGFLFSTFLEETEWDERMKARKTASYGVAYNYSQISYDNQPFTTLFTEIAKDVERELGFSPNNCLLNYYPDGESSMGFHSDTATGRTFGTGVAILSLGARREMLFKHKTDKERSGFRLLTPGSLIYLDDYTQQDWLHAIPKSDVAGPRISLSFRSIEIDG